MGVRDPKTPSWFFIAYMMTATMARMMKKIIRITAMTILRFVIFFCCCEGGEKGKGEATERF